MRKSSLLAVACLAASPASAETFRVSSLEWPPYASEVASGAGTFWAEIGAAYEAAGHELAVDFFPWQRAVDQGTGNADYIGYGPEYFSDSLDCLWSVPVGSSPVGFVQPADAPISWETVADLEAYTIGVVSGYVNDGGAFDAAIEAGAIASEGANSDLTNIRKVAGGRIDAAVIDAHVLNALLAGEAAELADQVSFNDRLLIEHDLHICFASHAQAAEAEAILRSAIGE